MEKHRLGTIPGVLAKSYHLNKRQASLGKKSWLTMKFLTFCDKRSILYDSLGDGILRLSLSLGDGKPTPSLSFSDSKPRLSPEVGDSMGFLSLFSINLKLYIQKNDILPTQAPRKSLTFPSLG